MKKAYKAPKLMVHGNVTALTQNFGMSGQPGRGRGRGRR
ncbi:lasso peptide [Phototrophicus methaneseepsis]|uniref:Lasso peptide n=1 Tax=Phototrophicus methaneseepsis TaxID=2710758 RepID=A0A7S8EDT8_9CHLR|nr:lasso peptide [Phototrophicus methaneseepsis]QPC85009.1 lasso peptide [Phototrophicus methaneseepsis]